MLSINAYNFWVVVFVAIGTISTAYGLAIIGSTVGQPNFYTYFNLARAGEPGYGHTSNIIAALNGVNSGGAIVGCIYNVWSAEKFGRKWTMMIGCVILILGGALCSGAIDLAMFIVGRGVAGMVLFRLTFECSVSIRILTPPQGSGILACVGVYLEQVGMRSQLITLQCQCIRLKSQLPRLVVPWFQSPA